MKVLRAEMNSAGVLITERISMTSLKDHRARSRSSRSPRWLGGVLVLGLCGATLPAGAAYDETHVYGIANFGHKGECGSPSMTHSVHTDTAAAFLSEFSVRDRLGLWGDTATTNNKNARARYFTDPDRQSWGMDSEIYLGVDDGDVMYVHTHGGHDAVSSFLMMGSSENACEVSTSQHMRFGDTFGDLEIAVIKACQSGDYDVWRSNGYKSLVTPESEFMVWNAFHGDSSCGSHVTTYVKNYSASSFNEGVGENWVDLAYRAAAEDDCPVSIVFGESAAQRDDMYEHGGFANRSSTGSKDESSIYFVEGCKPASGSVLPST